MKKITVFLTIVLLMFLFSTPTFAWEGSIWVRMLSFSDAFEVAWQQGPRPINRIMHTQGSAQSSRESVSREDSQPGMVDGNDYHNPGPDMVDGNDNYN